MNLTFIILIFYVFCFLIGLVVVIDLTGTLIIKLYDKITK